MVLQETYELKDYWWYSTTEYTSTTTIGQTLPSKFQLDFDIKPTSRSNASSYIEIGTDTNNCLVIGQTNSAGKCGVLVRTGGSYTDTTKVTTGTSTLSTDNHITFTFDGSDWSMSVIGETITSSKPSYDLEKVVRMYPASSNHIKNVKVIAL